MPELAIFQWGRLGDLVQTLPVVKRWQTQRSGDIAISFDARYSDAAKILFPSLHRVPVDLSSMHALAKGQHSHVNALRELIAQIGKSTHLKCNAHLVLSDSAAASLFSEALNPDVRLGYAWREGKHTRDRLLSEYLAGNGKARPWRLHICDVWSLQAGLSVHDAAVVATQQSADRKSGIVSIICDAGDARRTPPQQWLEKLAASIVSNCASSVKLLGARASQKSEINPINGSAPDMLDLRGLTSLRDLIAHLKNSDLVIGPDTGALHLAAALGVPAIGLYAGGASAVNTGPYSFMAAVLHDPRWTDDDVKIISDKVSHTGNHAETRNYIKACWWQPSADEAGLNYEPAWLETQARDALLRHRREFIDKARSLMRLNANVSPDAAPA